MAREVDEVNSENINTTLINLKKEGKDLTKQYIEAFNSKETNAVSVLLDKDLFFVIQ